MLTAHSLSASVDISPNQMFVVGKESEAVSKKQPKVEANVHVDEKVTKNPNVELDKKDNKINVGESEKKDKKEQFKKTVDPKIEKKKAAEKKELLLELSENPEKETLDWMTNEMKTFEKSDDSDSVNLLEAFCSERKRQERIHFLLPNGLYQRIVEDNANLTNEISRVKLLTKTWNPDEWEFTRLSEISADPINYLTVLDVISLETEVVLHRFINLFSTTELNFSNILSYPKNFVDEIEKAKVKYVKVLKAAGFEDGKLPPVKLVKELEKRKVMARMAACSIVLGPILDTFEFTFDNPIIFLAPFPFLMVLLIRKLVPCTMTANVYEVIRSRISCVKKSRKKSDLAQIFCCPHPIPAAAYAYYVNNKSESFEEPIWLIRAHNSIIKNQKSKEIWDKTISNARDASFGLVSNIKEWMEKNAEHEISTTAVEVKK
uniref:Uncharacterized protein n=1 Tax=Panagrolaimus sp. JU765 TaxID=591449 RepID=A0AC34REF2_9BILA